MNLKELFTSIFPIEFNDLGSIDNFVAECYKDGLISKISNREFGVPNKYIKDIKLWDSDYYKLSSCKYDIQVVKCHTSLLIVFIGMYEYSNYEDLVVATLKKKNQIVKDFKSVDTGDHILDSFIASLPSSASGITYAFTFYSIFDSEYSDPHLQLHLKVLAEPSLINASDMKSVNSEDITYRINDISADNEYLGTIKDSDISKDSLVFVTWSTVVTCTNHSEEIMEKNHQCIIQMEVAIQTVGNRCYFINNKITNFIKGFDSASRMTVSMAEDLNLSAYNCLIESRRSLSATFSGRLARIYNRILDTSDLIIQTRLLDDKIKYLNLYLAKVRHKESVRKQGMMEFLLFLLALLQLGEVFFELPLFGTPTVGYVFFFIVLVLGISLIVRKDD